MFTPLLSWGAAPEQACAEVSEFDKFLLKFARLCADFTGDQTGGCVGIALSQMKILPFFVSDIDNATYWARQYLCEKFGPSWADLEVE
jgi:hypothetical protein